VFATTDAAGVVQNGGDYSREQTAGTALHAKQTGKICPEPRPALHFAGSWEHHCITGFAKLIRR